MTMFELFLTALGLSMDAFAVAICKGMSARQLRAGQALLTGAYFGGFQALMPLLGWALGSRFAELISSVDHWIAFGLLLVIGLNMVRESRSKAEDMDPGFGFKIMLLLALATSIDALAVGIGFAFLSVDIVPAVLLIGITTFVLSAAGCYIGRAFGSRFKSKAELFGGIILILIGSKILLEHLGLL